MKYCVKCKGTGYQSGETHCQICNGSGREISRGKCVVTGVMTANKVFDFRNVKSVFMTSEAFLKDRKPKIDFEEWDSYVSR